MKPNQGPLRNLIVITFLTLDGVMQAPGGKEEDTEGSFEYGGWEMQYLNNDSDSMCENLNNAGALLLGRKTYDIFAPYWSTIGKSVEWYGDFMNNIPKYIASKTIYKTEWQNSTLLQGNLAEAIHKLKAEAGKDIYVLGSSNLSQTLMRKNLIDEYIMMIYPTVLGKGKRLFNQDGPKQDLELTKSKITQSGILVLNYKVKN